MNQRERMLAIVVGALVVLLGGYMLQSWIFSGFAVRQAQVAEWQRKLKAAKDEESAIQRAAMKIREYEARSLPSDPNEARNRYHQWLLSQAEHRLAEPNVTAGATTPERGLFVRHQFTVKGKGTLPEVVDLLHAFYSVDWLHRVKTLNVKPLKDTKQLDVTLTIEALSLNSAKVDPAAEPPPSDRLLLASRQKYHEAIVHRNLFGPPNRAPSIAVSGSRDAEVGRRHELTIRGTDPDKLDKLTYRLVSSEASEARLDPASGRFTWTPRTTGRFAFTFEVIDDGFPNKASRQEQVVLNVGPPRLAPAPPPPPSFDFARFTDLCGVLEANGQGEIWLHVRPTGQMLKLHEGDQFQVGTVQGKIATIGRTDFTFESGGKLHKLAKGGFLNQSQVISDAPAAVQPTSQPAEPADPAEAETGEPAEVDVGAAAADGEKEPASPEEPTTPVVQDDFEAE